MSAVIAQKAGKPLGLSAGSWPFAIRIWLAAILALYVSFWLELDAPSSAAVTVAILALPTRGQAMEKAGFRLLATVISVAASFAIVGIFAQSDSVILGVFAAWIGLCVYAVGMLDGNRAYAASLGVTTVAIVAIQQIDTPQQVFEVGVARGSAIAIGILATAFINDTLAAPDHHPIVTARLQSLHRQVLDYARSVMGGQVMPAATAAMLLRDITALRPDIASLATESSSGQARSSAARSAMVGLVAQLSAARALERLPAAPVSSSRGNGDDPSSLMVLCRDWMAGELLRRDGDVNQCLAALKDEAYPLQEWRAPLYRSHRIAIAGGLRAALYFSLASIFIAIAGWPTSTACLSYVAILIGLSATAPDVSNFMKLAVVASPIACVLTGILEFVILDGATGFPMLALGLAPFIIGSALMMTLANPGLAGFGRLIMVFIIALLAPSNPQSYDPQIFLISCLFVCLSTGLLFAMQCLVPPMSRDRQVRQLLTEARNEFENARMDLTSRFSPEENLFRDAMRIGKIFTLSSATPDLRQANDEAMMYFDRAAALRLCCHELARLSGGPLSDAADAARTSLSQRDSRKILSSAEMLRKTAPGYASAAAACSALVSAAIAFAEPSDAAHSEARMP